MLISNLCKSSIGMSSLFLPSPFSLYPSMSPQIPFRSFPRKRIQNKFPVPTFSLGYQNVVLTCKAEEDVEEEVGSSRNVTVLCKAEEEGEEEVGSIGSVTVLYSFSPLPLILLGALPGGDNTAAAAVTLLFGPFVELVKSLNLPYWLVHWGHPANMAVVLFAMGGYGTYLGFRIRFSEDVEEKAKAKDLHPKLLGGMFFFFALGATGGITSLLTSGRPIFESPHAVTGLIGLSLLTIQTILPTFFEGNPGLKNVHGILGSGIMTLFLVHSALGLQLGLA